MEKVTVLIADDHALFREGLIGLLESEPAIEVIGEANNGMEALEKARELQPDLILMDINMPVCDGLEATRLIKEEMPHVRVVMLTVSEEDKDLFEAIRSGAEGYLIKTMHSRDLFELLKGVFHGEAPISPTMATKMLAEFARVAKGKTSSWRPLSKREDEVLHLVAEGKTNKEIGDVLEISSRTVKNHLHNILAKLHLENRAQAIVYAMRRTTAEGPTGD